MPVSVWIGLEGFVMRERENLNQENSYYILYAFKMQINQPLMYTRYDPHMCACVCTHFNSLVAILSGSVSPSSSTITGAPILRERIDMIIITHMMCVFTV